MNGKRGVYEIRFQAIGAGRDGGFGPTKSFRANLSKPSQASQKLRCKGRIVSVVRVK